MDIDSFDLPEGMEQELEEKHADFVDSQEPVEAINDCESGACAI